VARSRMSTRAEAPLIFGLRLPDGFDSTAVSSFVTRFQSIEGAAMGGRWGS
jgi:hypothetical protein